MIQLSHGSPSTVIGGSGIRSGKDQDLWDRGKGGAMGNRIHLEESLLSTWGLGINPAPVQGRISNEQCLQRAPKDSMFLCQ